MTPAEVFDYTRDHGITLMADGDRLVIRADDDLPPELVAAAREHKPALMAALRELSEDPAEAVHEHLEERAAIQEHDGELSRPEAEKAARRNMRVFTYRLADNPAAELVLIAPGTDLDSARRRLARQFGTKRVIKVQERAL